MTETSYFLAKEVTCCYTVPLHHVARPRYPGSSLSGGVPQSRITNQGQSERGTSSCTLQVHVSIFLKQMVKVEKLN